jgi:hypothetical protein
MSEEQVSGSDPGAEKAARRMGWVPQEVFKGDSSKWVPAEEFLEKVGPVADFVGTRFEETDKKLQQLHGTVGSLQQNLKESKEAIAALKESNDAETRRAVEKARADLKAELKAAIKAGDADSQVEIQDELDKLWQAEATAKEKPAEKKTSEAGESATPQLHPEFVEWAKETPWFNTKTPEGRRKTAIANVIAQEMRDDGDTRVGKAFLKEVEKRVEEHFAEAGTSRTDRVAGGGSNGGGGSRTGAGGRGWGDIPSADRQAATEAFADRLVGPNKAYKTVAEWQKGYAERYWKQF